MTRFDDLLALLRTMEARQREALDMHAQQILFMRRQAEQAQARMEESMALQKLAVQRQARSLRALMPVVATALVCMGLLVLRNWG